MTSALLCITASRYQPEGEHHVQDDFRNLPVIDLKASIAFYKSLGFENNPDFTDDTAACMVWSEAIHVMLLTHAKWRTFTSRPIRLRRRAR